MNTKKTKLAKVSPKETPNTVTFRLDPWVVSTETSKVNTATYLLKQAKLTLSRLKYAVLAAIVEYRKTIKLKEDWVKV